MLIQCQACNTKYRLNLEQIPRRKTFVRCKSCGTPIYIDPTEEEAPQAGVIPPSEGTAGPAAEALGEREEGQLSLACPRCSARYRIAAASVQRPGVKLKCSQCGHIFALPAAQAGAPAAEAPVFPPGAAVPAAPEPSAPWVAEPPPAAQAPGEMPLPDEAHMEQLFDDLRPGPAEPAAPSPQGPPEAELGALPGAEFEEEPPIPDAEQAYLDSVAFDEEGGGKPQVGSVPDAQKYRFFLNPKAFQGSDRPMADQPEDKAPEQPPEETGPAPGAAESPELPGASEEPELPPLPSTHVIQSHEEMAKVREVVPDSKPTGLSEKRVLAIVAAASVLVLAGAGIWGYWLASTAGNNRKYQTQVGQPQQLVMKSDVKGHYVTNGPTGTRLFVVSGAVRNDFAAKQKIRWIRIKGVAYTDATESKTLGTTFSYAGNVLTDSQLQKWELPAVKAYYGFTNGQPKHEGGRELNLAIAPGASVPYQLVFTTLSGKNVGRTVAEVVSYFHNGRAVFVNNP